LRTEKVVPINPIPGIASHIAHNGALRSLRVIEADGEAERVKLELAGLVPGVKDAGENEHTPPCGTCEQESETGLLTEVTGVTVMV